MDHATEMMESALRSVANGERPAAPAEYVAALSTVGLIELGWDCRLKPLGQKMLNVLSARHWERDR